MSYTTTALINNNKKEKKTYPKFSFKSAAQMQQGFTDLSSSPLLSSLLLFLLKFSFFRIFMIFLPIFDLFIAEGAGRALRCGGWGGPLTAP